MKLDHELLGQAKDMPGQSQGPLGMGLIRWSGKVCCAWAVKGLCRRAGNGTMRLPDGLAMQVVGAVAVEVGSAESWCMCAAWEK